MLFLLGTWRSIEHLEGIAQENMTGHPALILFLDKMRQCVSRESTAQYIRCGLSIKEAILRSGPYVFLSTPLQIRPFREAVCAVVDGGVGSQDALDCCLGVFRTDLAATSREGNAARVRIIATHPIIDPFLLCNYVMYMKSWKKSS